MSTSAIELRIPDAIDVTVCDDTLSVELSDGRTISKASPSSHVKQIRHARIPA